MSLLRPDIDPFYAAVDAATSPGELVRTRRVELRLGVDASAWQLVYGSTGSRDQPIAVSGTLIVPSAPWPGRGPRPILTYGVGVHGLGRDCAPSYLMRLGTEAELSLVELALARGWAVAITDGEGLGMPGPHTYGAARSGGHAMIDIVRASARCTAMLTPSAPVLIWGYSEGGRYAAAAGELAPTYAPGLNLRAVAAGGVPSDLRAVAKAIDGGPFSGLGLAVLVGLAHAHRDEALDAILTERGRVAAAHAATLDVVGLIVDHPEPMRHHTIRDEPWDDPAWRAVLDAERTGRRRPEVPVYLYHVVDDYLVPTALGRQLLADYRALGASVVWADVQAEEHLAGAFVAAPDAVETLREALAAAEAGLNARALDGPSAQREREAERQAVRRHSGQVEAELRRIRADVEVRSGELEALRGRLSETDTELVRVRSELGRRVSELQAMRTRAESAEAEATSAMGRVVEAERESDEARREAADAGREAADARRLAQELEGTDERADGARRALVEMREEHERERERSAMAERDLREALVAEQTRRAELEQRLSEVEGSAFAAERAFDELGVAQDRMRQALRALADPDAP